MRRKLYKKLLKSRALELKELGIGSCSVADNMKKAMEESDSSSGSYESSEVE